MPTDRPTEWGPVARDASSGSMIDNERPRRIDISVTAITAAPKKSPAKRGAGGFVGSR